MDPRPLLLQLRLRGRVDDPRTDESTSLVAIGHASIRNERLTLAAAGRIAADLAFRMEAAPHTESAAAVGPDAVGPDAAAPLHAAVRATYEQFLPRNAELIRVCTDWQVRPGGVHNDHRDTAYDWTVIDRLTVVDDRIGPVIRRLGRKVTHFDGYRPRLRAARTEVENGEHEWFTSPRIDSYHTVWMELHEHLLVALGLERASETAETS